MHGGARRSWILISQEPTSSLSRKGVDGFDVLLVLVFLVGLYTNYTIQISQSVPLPSAPAGIAGALLFWRRRQSITSRAMIGFFSIVLIFLVSVLLAPNLSFLARRF